MAYSTLCYPSQPTIQYSKSESQNGIHPDRKNFSQHSAQPLQFDVKAFLKNTIELGYHLNLYPEHAWIDLCGRIVSQINEVTGEIVKLKLECPITEKVVKHWGEQFAQIRSSPEINQFNNLAHWKKRRKEPGNILKKLNQELNLSFWDSNKISELYKKQKGNNKLIKLIDAVEKSKLISPKAFINAVYNAGYSAVENLYRSELPEALPEYKTGRQGASDHQGLSSLSISEQSSQSDDNMSPQDRSPCRAKGNEEMRTSVKGHHASRSARFKLDTSFSSLPKKVQTWNTGNNHPSEQQPRESLPAALSDKSQGSVSSAHPKTKSKSTKPPKPIIPERTDSLPGNSERKNTRQVITTDLNIKQQRHLQKSTGSDSTPMATPPASPLYRKSLTATPAILLLHPAPPHSQANSPEETDSQEPAKIVTDITSGIIKLQSVLTGRDSRQESDV